MRTIVCVLTIVWGFGLQLSQQVSAAERPHILLILADDLGYGDVGCYNPNAKINTPHLDRLAADGLRFTDAHAGGNYCVTSRYALLTGSFSPRMLRQPRQGPVTEEGRPTIATLLRDHGYRTAMVGKWHLGFEGEEDGDWTTKFDHSQPFRGGPLDRGFDSFFGLHASLDIPPYFFIRDRAAVEQPTETVAAESSVGGPEHWNEIQGGFWREGAISPDFRHAEVTTRLAEEAIRTIAEHAASKSLSPLFLYFALPSPHTPWLPQPEFRGQSAAGLYGDFVMQVDAVVGEVLTALTENGLHDNTLVLFSSDNGPVWFDKDVERFQHDSAGGLRGRKASSWEGGHRMPFLARWPGKIPAGSVSPQTICFSDLFATLGEMLGLEPLRDASGSDSVSFWPCLLDPNTQLARPPIVHDGGTIRAGDWKLILPRPAGKGPLGAKYAETGELYNLREDLAEQKNLIAEQPDRAKALHGQLREILGK